MLLSVCFRKNDIQLCLHKIFYLALPWQHNVYVFHLNSTVPQTVFLTYLVVSSSTNFIFKSFFSAGAVNAVSPANACRKENWNIIRTYIPNSALGSFSELSLIPKAQDAMTSVVYLYIVSSTSTGDSVNRPGWNCYSIFSYYIHMHSADVICFLVVSLEVLYLSLNLNLICGKYTFSLLTVPKFKLIFVFNSKTVWAWTCQSL